MTLLEPSALDPVAPDASAEPGRLADLAAALATLRTRGIERELPLERRLAIAGGVLIPLGAVLVLLAWYGAAHTSRVYLQLPYLISGGLLGLASTLTGGFCYFAYWLTRLLTEQRTQAGEATAAAERTAAALERIEALLVAADTGPAASPPRRRTPLSR